MAAIVERARLLHRGRRHLRAVDAPEGDRGAAEGLSEGWWPRSDSNGHAAFAATDFKSGASTDSATGPWAESVRPRLEIIQCREARAGVEAIGEIEREAEVAGPEREFALAVGGAGRVGLCDGMHREAAGAVAPSRITRLGEQLEEGVTGGGRAVAEAGRLEYGSCRPGEFAARVEMILDAEIAANGTDDVARRAVAELEIQRARR